MNVIQIEVAKLALKRMMESGHFSICVIDEILKMTNGVPNRQDYDTLHLLHCVNFKDFSQALRLEFPLLLQRVLQSPSMELEVKFKPLSRPEDFITLLLS